MANENTDKLRGTVWAIIDSGTRRLLGHVPEETSPGDVITVYDAVELQCELLRVPTPQGMASMYAPEAHPVDAEEEPISIQVLVANIRKLNDMRDGGSKYLQMYTHLSEALQQSRLRRLGIETASELPKGGIIDRH